MNNPPKKRHGSGGMTKMDNWFKSKWFIRFISLAFAVVLYLFVNNLNHTGADSAIPGRTTETETLNDVPVEIKIDSENYVVSGVPEFVTVSISGTPSVLKPITVQRNFDVFVDLEGLEEGEHTVEIEHNINNDLAVFIEPKTVDIFIEERATAEFPVSVDFINQDKLPQGYELGSYELNPTVVSITSSRSIIDEIGVVKVFVDVTGLEESINNREVPVNVYDTQGNELKVRIEPETVVVSAEVNNPSKTVKLEVPTKGDLEEGYSILSISANLEEVEVFARSEILEGITSISTEELDLSEIKESGTYEVGLALPEGVNVPEVETIEVSVEIEETKVLENLGIEVTGHENGQEVRFTNADEANITLVGNQSILSGVTADDFNLYVDLDGLDVGEHMVPIEIDGPELEDTEITVDPEEIEVEIE